MEAINQILMVFAVLGTLIGSLWVLRKKGFAQLQLRTRSRSSNRLELLERLPLTSQHSVCLIRVDDHILTVGLSPAGCKILSSSALSESAKTSSS